jgi:LmbE family N-acetylglucosaminyl deacetylase
MPASLSQLKKLIISPHVDDEVLGCGGILDKNSYVYYGGIDESRVAPDPAHRIPLPQRLKELKKTAAFLKFKYEVNLDSRVNFYVEQEMKDELERIINKIKPDAIFLAHPGYNQDHRTLFEAAQVALRPHDKNFFVSRVLTYEGIHDFMWPNRPFKPLCFAPIDIERKIKAYLLQPSQVRGMRSPDMLRHLAGVRGAMAHVPYAEAFAILRWVEK